MIKIIFVLLLIVLVGFGVYLALNQTVLRSRASGGKFILEPRSTPKNVGDVFAMNLILDPGDARIGGFDAVINFDPEYFQVNASEINPNGGAFGTFPIRRIEGRTIYISGIAYSSSEPTLKKPLESRQIVAVIPFKVLKTGRSTIFLNTSSKIVDISGVNKYSSSSEGSIDIETAAPRTANINGRVYNDSNRNGKVDDGEGLSNNFRVRIEGGSVDRTINTDSSAQFVLDNLPLRDYRITLIIPSGWERTTDDSFIVNLDSDKEVNFGITEAVFRLTGKAYIDSDGNRDRSSSEQPVEGIRVTVSKENIIVGTYTTNSEGNYEFNNLNQGRYRINFSNLPSGYQRSTDDGFEFELSVNKEIDFGIKR